MSSRSCIFTLVFGFSSFALAYSQASPTTLSSPLATPTFQSEPASSNLVARRLAVAPVGSVSGRVFYAASKESSGVDGVKLSLRSTSGDALFIREQVSDGNGDFTFDQLSPGEYTLNVDAATLPERLRINSERPLSLSVRPENETRCDIAVSARRLIRGVVFIDRNGDSRYTADKDEAVHGALVSANGILAVTDESGSYTLEALPSGRIAMLVQSFQNSRNATVHVVLDLGQAPVASRNVNIPIQR